MSGLVLIFSMMFLIISGVLYWTALEQTRQKFPPSLKDPHTARFAIDSLIWDKSFSADVRRKYLLSIGFGVIAFACMAIAAYAEVHVVVAAILLFLFFYGGGYGLLRWAKYKDRL